MNTSFNKSLIGNAVAGLLFVVLFACGGQPKLMETQAIARSAALEVDTNTAVEVIWRAASSGGTLGPVQFEPVVEGNTVYTATKKGHIEGFDVESGKRVFSKIIKDGLVNGVATNSSSIIAVTKKGEVVALDREEANEIWRFDVERSISAAPAANDQVVSVRTVDGQLTGINAATGKQLWSIERPVASLSVGLDSPGLIAGEGLVTGFSSGRVLASNLYNGSTFWERRAFRPAGKNEIERLIDIDATPVLAGPMVLLGAYRGGVVAYRMRDGEELWRNEDVSTRKPMAVENSLLGLTGPESDIALVDLSDGTTRWKKTQLRGNGLSAPIITQEYMIVGNLDGNLYFIDLDDGTVMSVFHVGSGPITSLLKVESGVLVYSSGSGKLTLIKA